jgi:hypothetical protein
MNRYALCASGRRGTLCRFRLISEKYPQLEAAGYLRSRFLYPDIVSSGTQSLTNSVIFPLMINKSSNDYVLDLAI